MTIDADVGGKVIAAGRRVRLGRGATVRNAAWLAGGSLEMGPGARIGSAVTSYGPEPPIIADGAEIGALVLGVGAAGGQAYRAWAGPPAVLPTVATA